MFRQMQSSGAQALHLVQDPRSGLQAIIAVQPGQRGPALAGCSYLPWEDEYQALQRTLQRARSMSYRTPWLACRFPAGMPGCAGPRMCVAAPSSSKPLAVCWMNYPGGW